MSQTEKSPIRIERIAHVVLFVKDPEVSAKWYSDILGMDISARAGDGPYKGGVFLSFGVSDHDIALFKAEDGAPKGKEFEHIGLRLVSRNLDELRGHYDFFRRHNVEIVEILDHGVSTGIYFKDPDGHMLEIFCQRVEEDEGKAIAELRSNQGQADLVEFDSTSH